MFKQIITYNNKQPIKAKPLTMKYLISLLSLLILTSCSSNYTVSTNLDKENFENYFAVGKVKTYQTANELPKDNEFVAIVEGSSCQTKAHLAEPDEVDAKNMAKRKANKLDANAIIFSDCVVVESTACVKEKLCYGKAYKVIVNE